MRGTERVFLYTIKLAAQDAILFCTCVLSDQGSESPSHGLVETLDAVERICMRTNAYALLHVRRQWQASMHLSQQS